MAKKTEKTRNTYDEVNAPLGITLNTSTYTKILDANPDRVGYVLSNDSPHKIFVQEQVPDDQLDRGFIVPAQSSYEPNNEPVGEIHAKSATGTPSILIVEI